MGGAPCGGVCVWGAGPGRWFSFTPNIVENPTSHGTVYSMNHEWCLQNDPINIAREK